MTEISRSRVLAEMFDDNEFAMRIRMFDGESIFEPVEHYLLARGIPEDEAVLLAMAYVVGSTHTLLHTQRALQRLTVAAAMKA